jgi:hypothetical protein
MARQRFIWPTIWDDPDLGKLDAEARLLYIGCFSLADDDGRIIGDPVYLKTQVFRYSSITTARVTAMRDQVAAACRSFCVYRVQGVDYIVFRNWSEFQKPKYPKPSKLPPPPRTRKGRNAAPQSQKPSGNDSGKPSETIPGTIPPPFPQDSVTGLGREVLSTKAHTSKADVRAANQLDPEKSLELSRIIGELQGVNGTTWTTLEPLAQRVPLAVLADLRTRCAGKGTGWIVRALRDEIRTRGAAA